MSKRYRREPRYRPDHKGWLRKAAPIFCLALVLPLAACQEDVPTTPLDVEDSAPPHRAHEPEAAAEEGIPAPEVLPRPGKSPLDLTLPLDPELEVAPVPGESGPPRLPNLFEPGRHKPSQVSGKLLFQEGHQEGAIDNVSGAQLEVNIPVD